MKPVSTPPQEPTAREAIVILKAAKKAGYLTEGFIEEQLAVIRRSIHDDTHTRAKKVAKIREKRELEPAQIEHLLWRLRSNFTRNNKKLIALHPNVQWSQVEASLRAQPNMMWSLSKMEETGGKVDVIQEDSDSFLFGDTSKESPSGRRNVVFNARAEAYLRKHHLTDKYNGNAEDKVREWGVDFMDEQQYKALQQLGDFDNNTWSWLKTAENLVKTGFAFIGDCLSGFTHVHKYNAASHDGDGGFRCVLRVLKMKF